MDNYAKNIPDWLQKYTKENDVCFQYKGTPGKLTLLIDGIEKAEIDMNDPLYQKTTIPVKLKLEDMAAFIGSRPISDSMIDALFEMDKDE